MVLIQIRLSEMVPVIQQAKDLADKAGRHLVVVGFVCGTSLDPRDLAKQEAALRDAGVTPGRKQCPGSPLGGRRCVRR